MDKKTVILRAPVLTQSGYGCHARQIARWLFDLADSRNDIEVVCEPLIWGQTPWITDVTAYDGLIGRVIQSAQQKQSYDVSIQLQLPNEWNPFLANFNVGVTAAVETDVCNPDWVECVNKMDLVIVPSEFIKQTLYNSGKVETRVEVIPEAFPDAILEKDLPALDLKLTTKFNFLVFSQVTGNNPENDRKNIFYTVKWLSEVFKDSPDVGVVIKTNLSRNTSLDRINTMNLFGQLLMETRKTDFPKFYLLHGDMTEKEIASLYRHPDIKALVSLTRGEGYGLPILEAAASGLPVIVTNWSGHTEFLSHGKYIKVDYSLAPIHQTRVDGQIFVQNAKWAQPIEEDVKRKLKKFVENSTVPAEWAKDLAVKLQENYSHKAIAAHYDHLFKEII